jgi:hypothetical protein
MYVSFLRTLIPELNTYITRLPGPPISNDSALVTLLENNVLVGIGTSAAALAAHTRFDLAWVIFPKGALLLNQILNHIRTGDG